MDKTLEENFRKTIQLKNDVMDQVVDMMNKGLVIEHKVETEEEDRISIGSEVIGSQKDPVR